MTRETKLKWSAATGHLTNCPGAKHPFSLLATGLWPVVWCWDGNDKKPEARTGYLTAELSATSPKESGSARIGRTRETGPDWGRAGQ